MSVVALTPGKGALIAKHQRALRGAVFADVEAAITAASPLVRLGMSLPRLVDTVHAYRAARAAVLEHGGELCRELYRRHLNTILGEVDSLPGEARAAVLHELRGWDRYLADLPELRKLLVTPVVEVVRLTDEQAALLAAVTAKAPTLAPDVAAAWRQHLQLVPIADAAAWAPSLEAAETLAAKLVATPGLVSGGGLPPQWWTRKEFASWLNPVQGALFEPFGRAALAQAGEVERVMRFANGRAGHHGAGWGAHHANSELFMKTLPRTDVEALVAAGRPADIDGWLQFADDGVLTTRVPDWSGSRIGEAEATALMEFKAEEKQRLAEKLLDFHRRHSQAGSNTVVLVKFKGPVENGRRADIVCALRPPASDAPITYFAAGASHRQPPLGAELAQLGVDQRTVRLPITRDQVRSGLAATLVDTAVARLLAK